MTAEHVVTTGLEAVQTAPRLHPDHEGEIQLTTNGINRLWTGGNGSIRQVGNILERNIVIRAKVVLFPLLMQ